MCNPYRVTSSGGSGGGGESSGSIRLAHGGVDDSKPAAGDEGAGVGGSGWQWAPRERCGAAAGEALAFPIPRVDSWMNFTRHENMYIRKFATVYIEDRGFT